MCELTTKEKELIMDFISCAYGEGYSGGGEPYAKKIDIEQTIKSIGKKFGFPKEELDRIFD